MSVKLESDDLDYLDDCIKAGVFASNSHAFRALLRDHRARYKFKRRGLW